MKQRLIFFASAFILLGFIAHFLGQNTDVVAPRTTPDAHNSPTQNMNTNTNVNMNMNAQVQTSPPAARTGASAPSKPETAGAPSTEGSALGYLQTNSKRSWDIKRDSFSNQIRTLTGGALETKSTIPREAGDQFVQFYSQGLFGVEPSQVKFSREDVTDRTRLIYEQVVDGVPVYGGALSLFYENGVLTRVQNDLAPYAIESGSAPSSVTQAFLNYKTQASTFDVSLQDHASNRTILYPNGHSLVYAYEFVTNEADKGASGSAKSYHVLYNAADQFVIQRRPSAIR